MADKKKEKKKNKKKEILAAEEKTEKMGKIEKAENVENVEKAQKAKNAEKADKAEKIEKAESAEENKQTEEEHQTWQEQEDGQRHVHKKSTPRREDEVRQLKNRLNRMAGQLNGIGKMLDENRYCKDVLIQVAAVESALQSFGYLILKEHMETCVAEEIEKGNRAVLDEVLELVKKLK